MKNLVTRAQLAAMGGVSRAHVTQQCREGRTFNVATVDDMIDAGHPIIVSWLEKRDGQPTSTPETGKQTSKKATKKRPSKERHSGTTLSKPAKKQAAAKGVGTTYTPSDVEGLADSGTSRDPAEWSHLSIAEVVRRFGGEPQFLGWTKGLKLVEEIRAHRLKNEESEGSLIRRDLVETALLGILEEQNQRLLSDVPKTLARTIRTHAQSNISLELSEREVRSTLGKLLDATKSKVARRLRKH